MILCQADVRDYIERTMAYLACLNEESSRKSEDLTQTVEQFNCRLGGRRDCR